ncbi:unnamed protein product [Ceratitis capitata]|uniref:(Mediterranean fruit fly) hypothetical protein n=1 Tax=Ceratitis capitata TaxID=7213 RepID=A0A811V0R4_CERCA|nr:unnamed protein product [Ceratitis capitata]
MKRAKQNTLEGLQADFEYPFANDNFRSKSYAQELKQEKKSSKEGYVRGEPDIRLVSSQCFGMFLSIVLYCYKETFGEQI